MLSNSKLWLSYRFNGTDVYFLFIVVVFAFVLLLIHWVFFYSFSLEGMNTLIGYDLVPEAKILDSALRACRRLNDLASAIRILEAVKVSDMISDGFNAIRLVELQTSKTVAQSQTVSYT